MVSNYTVKNEGQYDDSVLSRVVSIQSNSKKYNSLLTSFDKRLVSRVEPKETGRSINEVYMKMDLTKLREVDGSDKKHAEFIARNGKNLHGDMVNLFIINLMLDGQDILLDKDYEYLSDLLMNPKNDIFLIPLVTYSNLKSDDVPQELYKQFVKKMLEAKSTLGQDIKPAVSFPRYIESSSLGEILELYGDENKIADFFLLDFKNGSVSGDQVQRKLLRLHRLLQNMERKNELDGYFLYGARAKSKGQPRLPTPARDTEALIRGLNAIGRTHQDLPHDLSGLPPMTWDKLSGYDTDSIAYSRLGKRDPMSERFANFSETYFDRIIDYDIPPAKNGGESKLLDQFNRTQGNLVGQQIATFVRESDNTGLEKFISNKTIYPSANTFLKQLRKSRP